MQIKKYEISGPLMKEKNSVNSLTAANVRMRPCLLRLLSILVIAGLIGAGACYSRTPSNETSQRFSNEKPESVEQEHRTPQILLDCASMRLKKLSALITPAAGGLAHSTGKSVGLTNASFDATGNSSTPCKEMSGLAAMMNSLGIVPSVWPVLGRVTARFGKRQDPFSGEDAFHDGLDIASHYGDAIRATADGIVATVKRGGSYGMLVVIDHGFGVASWYGHLSTFAAKVGAHVKRGQIIGYEGRTGRATGTHLHYEVRIDNTPVNPFYFLNGSESTAAGD
jgi:murein DD-endopeptidase MepM/ murein hydrolase activator NlpD